MKNLKQNGDYIDVTDFINQYEQSKMKNTDFISKRKEKQNVKKISFHI